MDKVKNIFKGDAVIWVVFFFLCLISIVEVYSATSSMTYKTGEYWKPLLSHCMFIGMGTFVVLLVQMIPCRIFRVLPVALVPLSLILLTWALFHSAVNDASRWVSILGVQFQPSEIAKGSLIVTVALILALGQTEEGASKRAFYYILGFTIVFCSLIVSENFSTAAILFLVIFIMMFIGRVSWKYLAVIVGVIALSGVLGYVTLKYTPQDKLIQISKLPMCHRFATWGARIKDHADKEFVEAKDYNISDNQQRAHANIAIATSNVIGKMPGNSVERDFLPQAFSDFIYAIIIEELGLLGGGFVAFLYVVLLFRAGRIASRCETNFPAFLIMGLALMLVIQALINMMVAVELFPVTGQPLPLISRGGTSIIVTCAYIGIMLSISRYAKKKKEIEEGIVEPIESYETDEYYSEENME